MNTVKTAIVGVIAGVINGFFGSGGGIIAVESLERGGIDQKKSHASSLLIILPMSAVSTVVYFFNGSLTFDRNIWLLLGSACAGGAVGAFMLGKIKTNWLDIIFTILIFAAGIRMVF